MIERNSLRNNNIEFEQAFLMSNLDDESVSREAEKIYASKMLRESHQADSRDWLAGWQFD